MGKRGDVDCMRMLVVGMVDAQQKMTCDETHFIIEASIEVFDGDEQVYSRQWSERIARDGI